ncbi:MAG: ATP synthase F1 subunit epsilon [Phycisphaerales bacterium]|nr:ATP synthase F1 subunit epsilon [Phycisphaerales bacterium]
MAKRSDIKLTVVTPERQVVSEAVESCVIPAHDGEIGILSDRAPLVCELGIGKLSYRQGAKSHGVYIDGGFAQVHDNNVTVLTSQAYAPDEITDAIIAAAQNAPNSQAAGTAGMAARAIAARRASALLAVRQGG